jgi:hypothetical protein
MGGVRIDELGQEGEEEERRLRVQHVHDDSLGEGAAEVPLAAQRDVGLGPPGEERPQAEADEVEGAGDLDGGERHGGRDDQGGET